MSPWLACTPIHLMAGRGSWLRHSLVPPVMVAMVPHDVLHRCQDVVKGLERGEEGESGGKAVGAPGGAETVHCPHPAPAVQGARQSPAPAPTCSCSSSFSVGLWWSLRFTFSHVTRGLIVRPWNSRRRQGKDWGGREGAWLGHGEQKQLEVTGDSSCASRVCPYQPNPLPPGPGRWSCVPTGSDHVIPPKFSLP